MTERRPTRNTPLRVAFARPWPTTRRGFKLWLLAIIIGMKGFGYATGNAAHSTESSLDLITRLHISTEVCGWAIIALCAFAGACSYCHYGRDRYGYMGLLGFSCGWAACFAVSPLLLDGPLYAYQYALTWVLIGIFVAFSAADPEPIDQNRVVE